MWRPCISGFSPLGVLVTSSLPSLTASHAQPEPNWVVPACDEIGAHLVVAAEVLVDQLLQLARQLLAAAALLHPLPEVDVVVVLADVVDDRRVLVGERLLADVLDRLAFVLGAGPASLLPLST